MLLRKAMEVRYSCRILCLAGLVSFTAATAAATATPQTVCSDAHSGDSVSLLQASQKLWAPKVSAAGPAPPAQSSLDQVLGAEEQVDLEQAVNYSVVDDVENVTNLTETGDVFMVKPIKGAQPMAVDPSTATSLRDCIMGDWSSWSECLVSPKTGLKGPHQVRQRSIVQPWMPGGAPCLPQLQGQECNVKKIV